MHGAEAILFVVYVTLWILAVSTFAYRAIGKAYREYMASPLAQERANRKEVSSE